MPSFNNINDEIAEGTSHPLDNLNAMSRDQLNAVESLPPVLFDEFMDMTGAQRAHFLEGMRLGQPVMQVPSLDTFRVAETMWDSGRITSDGAIPDDVATFAYQSMQHQVPRPAGRSSRFKQFAQSELGALTTRTLELQREYQASREEAEPQIRSRRAEEYANLGKNDKEENMTAREVVSSEVAVPFDWVSSNNRDTIIQRGMCPTIVRKPQGGATLVCRTCEHEVPLDYAFVCMGDLYCALHVPSLEACTMCRALNGNTEVVQTFDGRQIHACRRCIERRNRCTQCNNALPRAYMEVRMCGDCIEHEGAASAQRSFSYALKWVSEELGAIVKTKRMFSSEVEALAPDSGRLTVLGARLPRECGISGDGSINSSGREAPFETQTPRLGGTKGEELVQRMAAVFKEIGAKVNDSCGMHIHLDGKGIILPSRKERPTAILQLWKSHLVFEDVIVSFLPYARRNNQFCRMMRSAFSVQSVETCTSLLEAEKLWYKERTYQEIQSSKGHHYHSSRYFGVNFHSLFANGHLEIRYHSATLNARKILEWANLHALIMDAAANKLLTPDFLQEAEMTTSLHDKTIMLFDKIGLAKPSREYFLARQRKFTKKTEKEADEPSTTPRPSVRDIITSSSNFN